MTPTLADQFPRTALAEGAIRLPLDAHTVWGLVGDIGSMELAKGMIERMEVSGDGVGAIRTLHLPGGGAVVERIEEYSAEDLYYVYRVLDSGPVDLTHHLGLIRVVPAGPGACIVSWNSMAQPCDGKREEIAALLRANIDLMFVGIRRHFGLDPA
jgi:hypothetical protein